MHHRRLLCALCVRDVVACGVCVCGVAEWVEKLGKNVQR